MPSSMSHNLGRIIVGLHHSAVVQGQLEPSTTVASTVTPTPVSPPENRIDDDDDQEDEDENNERNQGRNSHADLVHSLNPHAALAHDAQGMTRGNGKGKKG